jgi:hypothetical protein
MLHRNRAVSLFPGCFNSQRMKIDIAPQHGLGIDRFGSRRPLSLFFAVHVERMSSGCGLAAAVPSFCLASRGRTAGEA